MLDTARDQVRATVDEARRAVWNLRQRETPSPEISHLFEQMAQQVSHVSHVPVRFEAFGRPAPVDRVVEHVVLMVAREAVYNAVRHAQPSEVRIKVRFEPDTMRMQVVDDGCGFDLEAILAMKVAISAWLACARESNAWAASWRYTSPGEGLNCHQSSGAAAASLIAVEVRRYEYCSQDVGAGCGRSSDYASWCGRYHQRAADMKVCAQAGSGEEAVRIFKKYRPDITLMDFRFPGMSGLDALRAIRRKIPTPQCVVLTTYEGDEDIHQAITAGALGYIIKGMSHETLGRCASQGACGNALFSATDRSQSGGPYAQFRPEPARTRGAVADGAGQAQQGDRRQPRHHRSHG